MRVVLLLLLVAAQPAFAHHEVVMATSLMPLMLSGAAGLVLAFGVWKRRVWARKQVRDK